MRKANSKKAFGENARINFLIFGFFAVCLIFVVRLFSIQVLSHSKYREIAEAQYFDVSEIPAKRGSILSADGYALAGNQPTFLMYSENKVIENKEKTANDIAEIFVPDFKENSDEFFELKQRLLNVLNLDLFWAILRTDVSLTQKEQIQELKIKGIGFEESTKRFYPEGSLAAHILGFVGKDSEGIQKGYFGIEGHYDGDLVGKSGRIIQEKDASGLPIILGGYKQILPIDGRNIYTTINRDVQYMVEKRLQEGVEQYDAYSGSVIVMDPFTGDIIAMANFPTFNPLNFNEEVEESTSTHRLNINRTNDAISSTYEPGSVMKAITVATAVDLKKVSPRTTFEDNGPVNYSGYVIDNWDKKHHGTQTIVELLQKSNNIGAAWVGHLVGRSKIYEYFKNFGLSERTQIGLEGEETARLRDVKEWTDIDLANISFGQGVSATPLQVLNSFNVIANGGELIRPRIITKFEENGKEIEIPVKKIRRVISTDSAQTMTEILEKAVEGGESRYFNIENYNISGKTGTAQIFIDGKYDAKSTNATFVGFLTNSKKFSMIVKLEKPRASTYASETAVPVWMAIADDLVKYYSIAPDK